MKSSAAVPTRVSLRPVPDTVQAASQSGANSSSTVWAMGVIPDPSGAMLYRSLPSTNKMSEPPGDRGAQRSHSGADGPT
jgi:hypothetical protein